MPAQDETSTLPPLERSSNPSNIIHPTCPPEDERATSDSHASSSTTPTASATAAPTSLSSSGSGQRTRREREVQPTIGANELPPALREASSTPQPAVNTSILSYPAVESSTAAGRYASTKLKTAATIPPASSLSPQVQRALPLPDTCVSNHDIRDQYLVAEPYV